MKKQALFLSLFFALHYFNDDESNGDSQQDVDVKRRKKLIPEDERHGQYVKCGLCSFRSCRNFIFWIPHAGQLENHERQQ